MVFLFRLQFAMACLRLTESQAANFHRQWTWAVDQPIDGERDLGTHGTDLLNAHAGIEIFGGHAVLG